MRFTLHDAARRAARGEIQLRIYRGGRCIRTEKMTNLVVSGAAQMKAHLLAGDTSGSYAIAKIGYGTSGTAAQESDTALVTPFIKNVDQVTVNASGDLVASFSLASTEANGLSLYEFGLMSASGILFARKVRDLPLLKASDLSITGTWTIMF
ncbi:MAG: hypothetical protein ABF876_05050 [Acetobacter aceti]